LDRESRGNGQPRRRKERKSQEPEQGSAHARKVTLSESRD
jgi:hypothetical protein